MTRIQRTAPMEHRATVIDAVGLLEAVGAVSNPGSVADTLTAADASTALAQSSGLVDSGVLVEGRQLAAVLAGTVDPVTVADVSLLAQAAAVVDAATATDAPAVLSITLARTDVATVAESSIPPVQTGQMTATLTAPTAGQTVTTGQPFTLTATGTGPISFMEFWADGTQLGTDATSPYSFAWTPATDGAHTVGAVANDGAGNRVASSNIGVTSQAPASAPTAPGSIAAPSGTAQVGQVLTAVPGTWGGSPAPTFTYQWQKATTSIAGATASTYTPVTGDVGSTIRVVITGTNASGSATGTSASTSAVIAAASGTSAAIPAGAFWSSDFSKPDASPLTSASTPGTWATDWDVHSGAPLQIQQGQTPGGLAGTASGCQPDQILRGTAASYGLPAPPGLTTAQNVIQFSVNATQYHNWADNYNATGGNNGWPHAKLYSITGPPGGPAVLPEIPNGGENGAWAAWYFIPTNTPRWPQSGDTRFVNSFQWKTDNDRILSTVDLLPLDSASTRPGFWICWEGWTSNINNSVPGGFDLGTNGKSENLDNAGPGGTSLLGVWFRLKCVIDFPNSTQRYYIATGTSGDVLHHTKTFTRRAPTERTLAFGIGHYAGIGLHYCTNAYFVQNGT